MAKPDQEQLLEIFNAIKKEMKEMKPYEKGNIKACIDVEGKYDLWVQKPGMFIYDRVRNGLCFATIIVQSTYVGFYYMPVYCNTDGKVKAALSPDLLKLLKGKACFHIKSADKEIMKNIQDAMSIGYLEYKKNGWL